MSEYKLNLGKMIDTAPYLCPSEEGCFLQFHDRPATKAVFKMAIYLYWPVVREQKN